MPIGLSEHFTYRKLIKFTIPTIIMMFFTAIYGCVDGFFVSNFVNESAFASVNLVWPVLMIIGSIGFMVGAGGSALVSKTLGEGKNKNASEYFSMLIYLLIIVGIVFSIFGIVFMRQIAILLKADENLIEYCVVYGRILLMFIPAFLLQNSFQSFLIVAEKPKFGLAVSIAAGVTNAFLDFLFIYVLKWGVQGAALATGLSQFVGALIPFIYFIVNRKSIIKLVITKFEIKPILMSLGNGSSEMVTNLSLSLVNILFNAKLMELIGEDGVIAYGIIMYVGFLFISVYCGYAIGTAPIIGYHYGAKNEEELKNLFSKSLRLIFITSVVLTVMAELLAGLLAMIFIRDNTKLLEMTTEAIRIFALSYLISGFNIFGSSFFTALNDGFTSALISFLRTLVFQIIAITIMPLIFGVKGLWFSILVSETCALILVISCLIKNKKKYNYM